MGKEGEKGKGLPCVSVVTAHNDTYRHVETVHTTCKDFLCEAFKVYKRSYRVLS